MTIPPSRGKVNSSNEDLSIPRALARMGVPVWHAKLNRAGGPVRDSWQKIEASASAQELREYRPGMAMCATAGVVFDVIDRDPKNDPQSRSWNRFLSALGDDGLDYFLKIRTPSGGEHYYIPTLGLGRKYNPIPGFPGVDLQAENSLVFLPPTVRKGGSYAVDEVALDDFSPSISEVVRQLCLRGYQKEHGDGREDPSDLKRAAIDAEAGGQRAALMRLVHEYERLGYRPEDIVTLLSALGIPNYDPGHPWRSADFRGLLHREGAVIGDAIPGELDGFSEPTVDPNWVSPAQKHANMLALMRARAAVYARTELSASEPGVDLSCSLSLSADLVAPRPAITWAVEDLATSGAQVTLPSSRKTGKTTFLLNLCRSAGNGTAFLDRFDCSMDGNIGYINAEMLRADILGYCDRLGGGVWTDRLQLLHCRENGVRLNLLSDAVCADLVSWCIHNEVEWLICDPWKNFLGWAGAGLNDNDAVLALSDRFRSIAVDAEISLCVIPMHTTQTPAEEGMERGKGAGELEDGADWLWRYTRIGGTTEGRVLSAEGRGPGVDEMVVSWDAGTGRLSAENVSRAEVRRASGADRAREALELTLLDGRPRCAKGELLSALKGTKGDRLADVRAGISAGLIIETDDGPGRPKWVSCA